MGERGIVSAALGRSINPAQIPLFFMFHFLPLRIKCFSFTFPRSHVLNMAFVFHVQVDIFSLVSSEKHFHKMSFSSS